MLPAGVHIFTSHVRPGQPHNGPTARRPDKVAMGLAALAADAASFLLMLTLLTLDLTGVLRQRKPLRMTITGLLIMNGAALIRMTAGERGWSHTSLLAVDWITLALTLAAGGIVLVGVLGVFRKQDGARPQ
jgi:hypothetical protein